MYKDFFISILGISLIICAGFSPANVLAHVSSDEPFVGRIFEKIKSVPLQFVHEITNSFIATTSVGYDTLLDTKKFFAHAYCGAISRIGSSCSSHHVVATSSTLTSQPASQKRPHPALSDSVLYVQSESKQETNQASSQNNKTEITFPLAPSHHLVATQSFATVSDVYTGVQFPFFDSRAVSVPYLEGRLFMLKSELGLFGNGGVAQVGLSAITQEQFKRQIDAIYDSMSKSRSSGSSTNFNPEDIETLSSISLSGTNTFGGDINVTGRLTFSGASGTTGQVLLSGGGWNYAAVGRCIKSPCRECNEFGWTRLLTIFAV